MQIADPSTAKGSPSHVDLEETPPADRSVLMRRNGRGDLKCTITPTERQRGLVYKYTQPSVPFYAYPIITRRFCVRLCGRLLEETGGLDVSECSRGRVEGVPGMCK